MLSFSFYYVFFVVICYCIQHDDHYFCSVCSIGCLEFVRICFLDLRLSDLDTRFCCHLKSLFMLGILGLSCTVLLLSLWNCHCNLSYMNLSLSSKKMRILLLDDMFLFKTFFFLPNFYAWTILMLNTSFILRFSPLIFYILNMHCFSV